MKINQKGAKRIKEPKALINPNKKLKKIVMQNGQQKVVKENMDIKIM